MITINDLADVFELFSYGIGIGGILSASIWVIAYTVKSCISFFKM